MPKAHELERRIQELELQRNDISREIEQRNEEIKDLLSAISDKTKEVESKFKDLKEALESVEARKGEYVVINVVPNQIMKESDKISSENE
jgi:chromosome segregation ATPase